LRREDWDSVIAESTKALEFDAGREAPFLYLRAVALYRKKLSDDALRDIARSIDRDANQGSHYHLRALIYSQRREYDLALEDHNVQSYWHRRTRSYACRVA
jgi:tetratricopeptide (TPR) repeat protein